MSWAEIKKAVNSTVGTDGFINSIVAQFATDIKMFGTSSYAWQNETIRNMLVNNNVLQNDTVFVDSANFEGQNQSMYTKTRGFVLPSDDIILNVNNELSYGSIPENILPIKCVVNADGYYKFSATILSYDTAYTAYCTLHKNGTATASIGTKSATFVVVSSGYIYAREGDVFTFGLSSGAKNVACALKTNSIVLHGNLVSFAPAVQVTEV